MELICCICLEDFGRDLSFTWSDLGTALIGVRAQWAGVARLTAVSFSATNTCQTGTAAINNVTVVVIVSVLVIVMIYQEVAGETLSIIVLVRIADLIATTTTKRFVTFNTRRAGIDISCWVVVIVGVCYPRSTRVQRIAGGAKTIRADKRRR